MNFNFFQARTADPCIYYSCEEYFSPTDNDVGEEQAGKDESLYIYNVRDPDRDARPHTEGLFFSLRTALMMLCVLMRISLCF